MADEVATREQLVFEAVTRQASQEVRQLATDYRSALSGMSDDALRMAIAQDKLDRTLSRHGPASAAAKRAELELRREIQATTAAAEREAAVMNQTATARGRYSSALVGATGAGRLIAGGAAVAGAVVLAQALHRGAQEALDFDRAMRNVNSIAHASDAELSDLSQSVIKLAAATGKGPTDLAKGLYDIVSSGFEADQALTILEQSGKAATAGLTDTATATKAVVALLNAYHLSAYDAKNVSDLLFQEVNLGVNTFEELAQNLGDTVPQAAALKIPFEQVAAALATITLHGTSFDLASTQVSRMLQSIAKPSQALREEFHHMGFESGQAAVATLGFAGVLQRLSQDAAGSQAKLAAWGGEARGFRGLVNLTGENLATFNDQIEKMSAATEGAGATQKAWEEQAKSAGFQIDRAKASAAGLADTLGRDLTPAVAGGASALADIANTGTRALGALERLANAPLPQLPGDQEGNNVKKAFEPFVDAYKKINPVNLELEYTNFLLDKLGQKSAAPLEFNVNANVYYQPGKGPQASGASSHAADAAAADQAAKDARKPRSQLDYQLDLQRADTDPERLRILRQHRGYLDRAIKTLEAEKTLTDKQKQRLRTLYAEREQTQGQIDQIIQKGEQAQDEATRKRQAAELAAQRRREEASPWLRAIHRGEKIAESTTEKTDDIKRAEEELRFWKRQVDQTAKTSGAYEHVLSEYRDAQDRLAVLRGKAADGDSGGSGDRPVLPRNLRIKQTLAQLHGNEDEELRVAKEIEAYWHRRRMRAKPSSDEYEALLQEEANAHQAVTSLDSVTVPRKLRIRQLNAALTETQDDDLSTAKAIENYWKKRLAQTKQTAATYEDILQSFVSAHQAVKDLEGRLSDSGPQSAHQTEIEFLTSIQDILRRYAPNYGQIQGFGQNGMNSAQAHQTVDHLTRQTELLQVIAGKGRVVDPSYGALAASFG